MDSYYDGLNIKLLNAIPNNSNTILELGCANGKLRRHYKEINKQTYWIGIDINRKVIYETSKYLDEAHEINIDTSELENTGNDFDVIVIGRP